MNERLKIFGIVALLGFLAGVIAQLTADYVIPWLMVVLPALVQVRFVVAGFAGAALVLVVVSIWAYATGNRDRV
jgi:cbb3-type cytochrome oxidase subunit 3